MKEKNEQKKKKECGKRFDAEFKRYAVELVVHGGKPLAQVARDLGINQATLHLWKRAQMVGLEPVKIDGRKLTGQEMLAEIHRQQKEIEYLRRQREILKKAMSILGEEPAPGMR